jgi:hypothetical protein
VHIIPPLGEGKNLREGKWFSNFSPSSATSGHWPIPVLLSIFLFITTGQFLFSFPSFSLSPLANSCSPYPLSLYHHWSIPLLLSLFLFIATGQFRFFFPSFSLSPLANSCSLLLSLYRHWPIPVLLSFFLFFLSISSSLSYALFALPFSAPGMWIRCLFNPLGSDMILSKSPIPNTTKNLILRHEIKKASSFPP